MSNINDVSACCWCSSGKASGASESRVLLPDIMCPDGSVAKRTLVVCPLCVVRSPPSVH